RAAACARQASTALPWIHRTRRGCTSPRATGSFAPTTGVGHGPPWPTAPRTSWPSRSIQETPVRSTPPRWTARSFGARTGVHGGAPLIDAAVAARRGRPMSTAMPELTAQGRALPARRGLFVAAAVLLPAIALLALLAYGFHTDAPYI